MPRQEIKMIDHVLNDLEDIMGKYGVRSECEVCSDKKLAERFYFDIFIEFIKIYPDRLNPNNPKFEDFIREVSNSNFDIPILLVEGPDQYNLINEPNKGITSELANIISKFGNKLDNCDLGLSDFEEYKINIKSKVDLGILNGAKFDDYGIIWKLYYRDSSQFRAPITLYPGEVTIYLNTGFDQWAYRSPLWRMDHDLHFFVKINDIIWGTPGNEDNPNPYNRSDVTEMLRKISEAI